MTEQDALLEAVFAAPADDLPRLVYADWLDDHGEAAHAAFIRAQIELGRYAGPKTRRAAVKNRETAVAPRDNVVDMKLYPGREGRARAAGTTSEAVALQDPPPQTE